MADRTCGGERTPAASARVIGTGFATGHAAALHALDPGEAQLTQLTRKELLRQGAILAL